MSLCFSFKGTVDCGSCTIPEKNTRVDGKCPKFTGSFQASTRNESAILPLVVNWG